MINVQTCLYLLKCARMTMLTAWPNIRKSLLHLTLLAELFSKGRAGKNSDASLGLRVERQRDLTRVTKRC